VGDGYLGRRHARPCSRFGFTAHGEQEHLHLSAKALLAELSRISQEKLFGYVPGGVQIRAAFLAALTSEQGRSGPVAFGLVLIAMPDYFGTAAGA